MKKSILVLALTALAWVIRADEVTSEQACAAVEAWRASNGAAFGDIGSTVSAVAQRDTDGLLLWYIVTTEGGGTVITAGDDCVEPILAILPGGDFAESTIPENHPLYSIMRKDVRGRLAAVCGNGSSSGGGPRLQSIAPVSPTLTESARAAKARWARLAGTAAMLQATTAGMPAMVYGYLPGFPDGKLRHWNQGSSKRSQDEALYNFHTPYGYVCGCVATATATMLQYFNVTNGPVAVTNACTVNGITTNLVTIGGLYDWSILPKGMGGKADNPIELLTDEQRELLGRVTYDAGVLLGMMYDVNGTASGAFEMNIAKVLKNYYGFETAKYIPLNGDEKKDKKFYDRFIYNQLRCGAPVGLSISQPNGGGHSVVAVGYGEDFMGTAYTHVFMGWGGSGDAWYNLPKVGDYPILDGIVSMISLDGNCLPVCGRVVTSVKTAASEDQRADNLTGAAFVPVEVTMDDETQTIYSSANGCFALRVPMDASGFVKVGDEEITFGAGEDDEEEADDGAEEEAPADEVDPLQLIYDTLPETMQFTLPATDVVPDYPTPSAAYDKAKRTGRMLLLVSGRAGDTASDELRAMLAERVDELNANYVVYYSDYDTDSFSLWNSYPALAVFNPSVFDIDEGWSAFNGCLASLNMGAVVPKEGEDEETAKEKALDALFAETKTAWNRINNDDMVLRVDGVSLWVDQVEKENLFGEMKTSLVFTRGYAGGWYEKETIPEPYGTDIANGEMIVYRPGLNSSLTNGESVTALVPEVWTNDAAGVVSACSGWVRVEGTNVTAREVWIDQYKMRLFEEDPDQYAKIFGDDPYEPAFTYLDFGDGSTVEFTFGYPEATLVWLWEDVGYRVRVEVKSSQGTSEKDVANVGVDLDEAWFAPGENVTITASEAIGGSTARPYWVSFDGWGVTAGPAFDYDTDEIEGCVLTFRVTGARDLEANFSKNTSVAVSGDKLRKVGLTISVSPAELAGDANLPRPKFGARTLDYGANPEVFIVGQKAGVTLEETTFSDADNVLWRCTGWTNGTGDLADTSEGDVAHVGFMASEDSSITFTWEQVSDDEPLELELTWSENLNNLQSGDEAAEGQNILVAKSALPKSFKLADYSAKDVKNTLTGWTVTGIKLDKTGNLVAVLATNDTVLTPKGVGMNAPITITSNGDGTVTVSSTISNAAKGFWYSLFAAEELGGPWAVVASGEYDSGVPSLQATMDGTLGVDGDLSIVVSPTDAKRFYRLRVTEKKPE